MDSYPENFTVKHWAEEDQPREKLLLKGKQSLSDAELIAILLRSGVRNEPVTEVSKKILNAVGNDLNRLGKLSVQELMEKKIKGIGETKAITLVAALELGRRRQKSEALELNKVTASRDVFNFMQPTIGELAHEEFHVLFMNRANKIIQSERISAGGITGTVADSRIIFNYAIRHNAVSIILCHNHPSGNMSPSNEDIDMTKKIVEAGKMLDIKVLDHLIVTEKGYYSFADEGLISF